VLPRAAGLGVGVQDDVLDAAREMHGLERMEQVRHAILERNGKISIIPRGKD